MPVSFPGSRDHDEGRGCGGHRLAPASASWTLFSLGSPRLCRSQSPSLASGGSPLLSHLRELTHCPCFSHTSILSDIILPLYITMMLNLPISENSFSERRMLFMLVGALLLPCSWLGSFKEDSKISFKPLQLSLLSLRLAWTPGCQILGVFGHCSHVYP